ncbi:MAG: CBS domain-containing protein, partial [Cyanobacteriota bacterium]|nr:CBS domain-containing protein [Cyanobacteriota bacterium]
ACWVARDDDSERLWGLITDGDLRRALQSHPPETWNQLTAHDLMTLDPITITGDTLAIQALERMERNRRKAIGVLPVVGEDALMLGLLRLHDLVRAGLTSG